MEVSRVAVVQDGVVTVEIQGDDSVGVLTHLSGAITSCGFTIDNALIETTDDGRVHDTFTLRTSAITDLSLAVKRLEMKLKQTQIPSTTEPISVFSKKPKLSHSPSMFSKPVMNQYEPVTSVSCEQPNLLTTTSEVFPFTAATVADSRRNVPPVHTTFLDTPLYMNETMLHTSDVPHKTDILPVHTTDVPPVHTTDVPPVHTTDVPPVHTTDVPPVHTTDVPPVHTTDVCTVSCPRDTWCSFGNAKTENVAGSCVLTLDNHFGDASANYGCGMESEKIFKVHTKLSSKSSSSSSTTTSSSLASDMPSMFGIPSKMSLDMMPTNPRLHSLMHQGVSSSSHPRILIVARRHIRKMKIIDFVGEYHIDLIQKFGGAPVIIPRTEATFHQLLTHFPIDGLLIVEGEDLGAEYRPYGGAAPPNDIVLGSVNSRHVSDTCTDPSKDKVEWLLLKKCLEEQIPFLGICRGCQILNVFAGGTLYFDISTQVVGAEAHLNYEAYDTHRHDVQIVADTPMDRWYRHQGANNIISVNSYHHQGVADLASPFEPMCHAMDGLVEAFYDPTTFNPEEGHFCVGIQFHPERMGEDDLGAQNIYKEFVVASHNCMKRRLVSR